MFLNRNQKVEWIFNQVVRNFLNDIFKSVMDRPKRHSLNVRSLWNQAKMIILSAAGTEFQSN